MTYVFSGTLNPTHFTSLRHKGTVRVCVSVFHLFPYPKLYSRLPFLACELHPESHSGARESLGITAKERRGSLGVILHGRSHHFQCFDTVSLATGPPHHNRFTAVFRDHPVEPVPEENFWTLWCKGRLTEADTLTIRLSATPSGITSASLTIPPTGKS